MSGLRYCDTLGSGWRARRQPINKAECQMPDAVREDQGAGRVSLSNR